MNNKSVVLVEPHTALLQRAHDLDIPVISIFQDATPAKEIAKLSAGVHAGSNIDDLVNSLASEDIAGIASISDAGLETAVALNERLSPKRKISPFLKHMRDKQSVRQALGDSKHNVEFWSPQSDGGLDSFLRKYGPQFVSKPRIGTISTGVAFHDDGVSVRKYFDQLGDERSAYFVENCVEGTEISVESFSIDGEHQVVAIWQKEAKPESHIYPSFDAGFFCPPSFDDSTIADIETAICDILDRLNYHDGPSHAELMVTENGVKLIEIHPRLGGVGIPDYTQMVTGVDMQEMWLRHLVGLPHLLVDPVVNGGVSLRVKFSDLGSLKRVRGITKAQATLGVIRFICKAEEGKLVTEKADKDDFELMIVAADRNVENARAASLRAIEEVRFDVA